MFDWFAARPPGPDQPERDRPTIPLTTDERQVFDSLCEHFEAGPHRIAALAASARGSVLAVSLGVALVLVGGAWTVALLTVNVLLSFVGVLIQAVGLVIAVDAASIRVRSDGSAARLEASPPQPDAHRRPGM